MEKHIMGENGISYTLGEDGLYYPDLYIPEETEYPIGKYGMLRKSYLQEHRKGLCLELVLAGKLNEHLHQIDEECNGYEVMVMNVESEEGMPMSIHFNPFEYIRNESDLMSIAGILMKATTPPEDSGGNDQFFEQSAEVLLTSILYMG